MTFPSLQRVSQTARPLNAAVRVIPPKGRIPSFTPKPAVVQEAEFRAWADAQPTIAGCVWCPGWRFEGTALEAKQAALEHRRELHPEARGRRRQASSLHRVPVEKGEAGRESLRRAREGRAA